MATAHPRIGVVKDAELAAAMTAARDLLSEQETRSEAGLVRRLAIIGAHALAHGDGASQRARYLQKLAEIPGVRLATRPVSELPWPEGPPDPDRRGSAALDWARGEH